MAQPKAPYDPVKAVEGQYNGVLIRLGQLFKEPENYGPSTKVVLNSVVRRYQDALDDCEIQILEAKWYLEHQLMLNKVRREAQLEKESVTLAKRKLDTFKEAESADNASAETDEQPMKRQRLDDSAQEPVPDLQTEQLPAERNMAPPPAEPVPTTDTDTDQAKEQPTVEEAPPAPDTAQAVSSKPESPPQARRDPPAPAVTQTESRPSTSHGGVAGAPPSMSGQNTPATAAEEFNFESMFGEPSGDPADAAADPMDFDNMDLGNTDATADVSYNDPNAFNLQDPSLTNLLPGLESYAKQGGDGMDFSGAGGTGNEFDLPDLGASTFDDFLNDNSFIGGTAGDGTDDFLKDDSMMNLEDLDASFFDTS